MSLKDYLCKYFPNGAVGGSFEDQTVDLIPHMLEKFGVNVKQEGNLFLFKYDQLLAKFSYNITHECRGHIWRYNSGIWNRVCNPADKFFNLSEGYCPIFNDVDFIQKIPSLSVYRKEDGTLCNLFFDSEKNTWRVSTSGCITPLAVQDYDITFSELFFKILNKSPEELTFLDKNFTYCFELCCDINRIVSKYKTNRLYLLLIRHNKYGVYVG